MTEERLQKFLAGAGIASRRRAEEYIRAGRVKVNGQTITEMGFKVNPDRDKVTVDGKEVKKKEQLVYLLLNKPPLVMTTLHDPQQRPIVTDYLKGVEQRVYPVGRLDYESEGLLLLTNDGELAYRLTHPRYQVPKTYEVKVQGRISPDALQTLREGVLLEDGITQPAKVQVVAKGKNNTLLTMTIREGRNRQIRRMCDKVGYSVLTLRRISLGPLELGNVPSGQYRFLNKAEISSLKKSCRLNE
ncbi:MAG: pseudouridine synthase [Peptococcia bacterium]